MLSGEHASSEANNDQISANNEIEHKELMDDDEEEKRFLCNLATPKFNNSQITNSQQ